MGGADQTGGGAITSITRVEETGTILASQGAVSQ
jgi:hypothetical protein